MTSIKKTVGENLRKVCKTKGIKQIDIAEYIGVSAGCVSNWFRGGNSLDIDNLYKICQFLGVSLDQIFGVKPIIIGVLNNEEDEILSAYRKSSESEKNVIRRALGLPDLKKDASNQAI